MKYILIIFICLSLENAGCKKKSTADNCNAVTVTQTGTHCNAWGIKVGINTYTSNNIPEEFKKEGLSVCADYQLYDDMRLCVCCGGTWADIHSMSLP